MSQMMDHMCYKRVSCNGKGTCHGGSTRGFKLNSKRFCVPRLRSRFIFLLKLLDKCKFSCGKALRLIKKLIRRSKSRSFKRNNSNSSGRSLVCEEQQKNIRAQCRLRSYGRSNSFYAEAIADCLEFIKRSSVSADSISVSSHSEDRSS